MTVEPATQAGRAALAAITEQPRRCLAAFDYDGTLAPIVADPAEAVPADGIMAALGDLGRRVGRLAVVTGRPPAAVLGLAKPGGVPGLERLLVLGQYGLQRWDATTGQCTSPPPDPGLARVRAELPRLLAGLGLGAAHVEDKGLAIAVHTRRLPEPERAFERLVGPLGSLAERGGLVLEPGRVVLELRPPGMDKGAALRGLVGETQPGSVLYAGDDLGDLPAYDEVGRLRTEGVPGLLVCSASAEVGALAPRADLIVQGPDGVRDVLHDLVRLIDAASVAE
ncbi:MAG TPA: trehalose-phosphatase [Nocardioidaceae bacterium]|nr:trehalose-phosphatase [Nocardioidaceae bacterium]